ncbi:MAG: beta-class carbonic anhydrase [Candidatus Thorarchaeota archaeon]
MSDQFRSKREAKQLIEESFRQGGTRFFYFYNDLTPIPEYNSAIITCMDCRITTENLGIFYPGKVIIIRTAGALFTPDVLRSLLISIYELKVTNIAVVGHLDCGGKMSNEKMKELVKKISNEIKKSENEILNILGKRSASEEFLGFTNVEEQVKKTVKTIKSHPLIPKTVEVNGYIYNPHNGTIVQN